MRNSLVPLIAAVVLLAIGVVLIRPKVDRGQGGPEVNAGILRLPKRDPIRTPSADLAGSTAAKLLSGMRDDGLWRTVVVAGDDREPTTQAAMLALGESLYTAGMIALMDPVQNAGEPTPPWPLPADRIIRIATRESAIGASPSAPWRATLVFTISEPRLPAGHPAEGLLPPPVLGESVVLVEHDGRPGSGQTPGWPERWAATGRSCVQAMLGALLPPSGLQRAGDPLGSDWNSAIPFPTSTPELRWAGAFQHDLARGWIGFIAGRTITTNNGIREAAVDPLLRRLKNGTWQPVDDGGAWRQWTRLRDGVRQHFAIRDRGDGWSASMWIERPDTASLIDGWLAAARTGDAGARAHLRRLLSVPGLPEVQRVRIEQAGR